MYSSRSRLTRNVRKTRGGGGRRRSKKRTIRGSNQKANAKKSRAVKLLARIKRRTQYANSRRNKQKCRGGLPTPEQTETQ
jgi:hypothetical protein